MGLARFVRQPGAPVPVGPSLPATLARLMETPNVQAAAGERCELCGEPVVAEHGHVVNLDNRGLMCACRPCYLLFTKANASGRYASVPDRYLSAPGFGFTPVEWDELQIPVGVAFFFVHSGMDKLVAFYPSPAGATECELPGDRVAEVLAAHPLVAELTPDVEALLVRGGKSAGQRGGGSVMNTTPDQSRYEGWLVPIDACYELVGLVRARWRGFDGGEEAWEAIDGCFSRIAEQARALGLAPYPRPAQARDAAPPSDSALD